MSSLTLALQQLSDLLPRPTGDRSKDWRALPGDRLCKCLERDLVPALAPLWTRPSFQRLALWPIVTWLPGCDTPQRLLLGQLKQAITQCAEATCDFAREHADLLNLHFPAAAGHWRKLNGAGYVDVRGPSINDALVTLKHVTTLCQEEWASAEDYFGPRFNVFFRGEGKQKYQRGEFVIDFNPELRHLGNFITRCLLVRAGTAVDLLKVTVKEFEVTLVAAQSPVNWPWREQQVRIGQLFGDLRHACLHAQDALEAEAAMCMVQIGKEFSGRQLDLGWLPPEATKSPTTGRIQPMLVDKRDLPTALFIREALATFEKWWTARTPADSALEEAIETRNLVVVEASREAYWKGRKLDADWHQQNRPWQLLLALARTRGRNFVSHYDLFDDAETSDSAFPRVKNRLVGLLPAGLSDLIIRVPAPDSGYQLKLPSQAIHFFPA